MTTFTDLGVVAPITSALAKAGITDAFQIQELCIPQALEGRDLIGQAKTGTGKTLGFGIPLLQRIPSPNTPEYPNLSPAEQKAPKALVVVPTRELCVQVTSDLTLAGAELGVRVLAVYGGRAYEPQVEALAKGVDVVVGTPGRLIDLARQRLLHLGDVQVLVLDEADEMLDMGFLPDVERIVSMLPATRQTMLFSATMPGQIIALARRYMTQPTHIRALNVDDDSATVAEVEQHVWRVHPLNKVEILARVMQAESHGPSMVFCRTKRRAQAVADELTERGFAAGAVHGDLGQGAREQALRAFRNGKVDILVATDVAARGIDVEGVTHVINYECPDDEKTYLHRVGRTARAGASGVAITFVDWQDVPRWGLINKALGLSFHDPIETYHTSEHLYTGVGIPAGTTGRLPRKSRTHEGLDAEVLEDLGGRQPNTRDRDRDGRGGSGAGGHGRGHTHHHGQTIPHGHKDGAPKGGSAKSGGSKGPDSGAAVAGGSGAGGSGDEAAPRKRRNRTRNRTRGGQTQGAEGSQGGPAAAVRRSRPAGRPAPPRNRPVPAGRPAPPRSRSPPHDGDSIQVPGLFARSNLDEPPLGAANLDQPTRSSPPHPPGRRGSQPRHAPPLSAPCDSLQVSGLLARSYLDQTAFGAANLDQIGGGAAPGPGARRRTGARSVEADLHPVALVARGAAHPRRVVPPDDEQVHARQRQLQRAGVRGNRRDVAVRARDDHGPQRRVDRVAAEQGRLALDVHAGDARVGDGPGTDAVECRVAHQLAPIRAVGAEAAVPSTSPRASCR